MLSCTHTGILTLAPTLSSFLLLSILLFISFFSYLFS